MTDDELRLKIAEAKGMKFYTMCGYENYIYPAEFSIDLYHDLCKPVTMITPQRMVWEINGVKTIPDWPNDIAAAWGLVEELPVKLALFRIEDGSWIAQVTAPGVWFEKVGGTAARAICLAWLEWLAWKATQ